MGKEAHTWTPSGPSSGPGRPSAPTLGQGRARRKHNWHIWAPRGQFEATLPHPPRLRVYPVPRIRLCQRVQNPGMKLGNWSGLSGLGLLAVALGAQDSAQGWGRGPVCTHMHTHTCTCTWPHCSAGEPHNDRGIPASSCCTVGWVDQKEVIGLSLQKA